MPGGDRTGPNGTGPMTGRRAGFCAGYRHPEFMNPTRAGGAGRGGRRGGRRRSNWDHHRIMVDGEIVSRPLREPTAKPSVRMAAIVDFDKCTGCGRCVSECPAEAISLSCAAQRAAW